MRVAAVHTYVGGFPIGIRSDSDIKLVADYESWKHGINAAIALGLPVKPLGEKKTEVDMVIANPPCSRFSNFTQKGSFDQDDYVHVKNFCELQDVVDVVHECKARTLWWETGPLCWNKGRTILANLHEHLRSQWGRCQTILVLYDTRYGGIPQRRPRCHVIHTAHATQPPPKVIRAQWPIELKVKAWVDRQIAQAGSTLNLPCQGLDYGLMLKGESALNYTRLCNIIGKYISARPRIIHPDDAYASSVVSRPMVWDVIDRWLDIAELAALQCYPINEYTAHARTLKKRYIAVALLSKSVSPSASNFLWRYLVKPWLFNEDGETDSNSIAPIECAQDMYEIRLTVKDEKRKSRIT